MFRIAILSNQLGIGQGHINHEFAMRRMDCLLNLLFTGPLEERKDQIILMYSPQSDYFRKPRPGMWHQLLSILNSEEEEQQHGDQESNNEEENKEWIYVGDAAGRLKTKNHVKDHSKGDIQFAHNIKAQFLTPEAFFLKSDDPYHTHPPPPHNLPSKNSIYPPFLPSQLISFVGRTPPPFPFKPLSRFFAFPFQLLK